MKRRKDGLRNRKTQEKGERKKEIEVVTPVFGKKKKKIKKERHKRSI